MEEVILDVDTGVDDALALLLAVRHPGLNVRAITCVAGNTDVDGVVRNTLTVLETAGAPDIPVGRGAERPLLADWHDARHVHGADGLADLGLPAPTRRPSELHAVELMRRQIADSPTPVTLITLAPMTNTALLLRSHPEVAAGIKRIVFMGGTAAVGNATPVAEFNVWHDPEAAALVLGAGVPLTMYGLDVFYDVALSRAEVDTLAAAEEPGTRLAGRLLRHLSGGADDTRIAIPGGAGLGDAGAVCAAADPGGLRTTPLPVRICLAEGITRGQTVVDRRGHRGESDLDGAPIGPLVDVALGVDASRYRRLFLDHACGKLC
ncbi:nucleoside hydrolase [Streptomyces sp. NRRL F-4489]|uniref:nucleoside hydrolase n=1 Tax=Streptomyces sp. NRRL F-4489 TaxID=1609095 RepID=UPI000747658E|nr:nucleoside hydrolase [Streptomyces sp. NRRL F-4489]KUL55549.1 nucleoside hydrolase [Streptomyces sp. NRRL F-4489]